MTSTHPLQDLPYDSTPTIPPPAYEPHTRPPKYHKSPYAHQTSVSLSSFQQLPLHSSGHEHSTPRSRWTSTKLLIIYAVSVALIAGIAAAVWFKMVHFRGVGGEAGNGS